MQQDKRLYALEHEKTGKLLFRYALPAVVGTMVNSLYNIVDRIFIGQFAGDDVLAGLAITFPIIMFAQAFGMLVGAGASVRISILLGRKEFDMAERVLGNAIVLTFFFNAMVAAIGYTFMDPLLRMFGATDGIISYAKQYLTIALGFNIFLDLTFSYNAIIRTTGYPTKAMITMLIGAILNIILDPIFIGVFRWGIAGAAWASNISLLASTSFVMSHFFSKKSVIHFSRRGFKLSLQTMKQIVSIGIAPWAMMIVGSVVNIVINRSFNAFGQSDIETNSAIAAFGIILSISQLFIQFMVGVSLGGQPIIGFNYGAGHVSRSISTYKAVVSVNVAMACIGFIIANFFPSLVVGLFNPGADLAKITNTAIGITFLCFPVVGVQVSTTQFFQALGKSSKAMFISLTRQALYLLPLLLILPRIGELGLKGVWMAMPIADFLAGTTAIIMVLNFIPKFRRQNPERPIE